MNIKEIEEAVQSDIKRLTLAIAAGAGTVSINNFVAIRLLTHIKDLEAENKRLENNEYCGCTERLEEVSKQLFDLKAENKRLREVVESKSTLINSLVEDALSKDAVETNSKT